MEKKKGYWERIFQNSNFGLLPVNGEEAAGVGWRVVGLAVVRPLVDLLLGHSSFLKYHSIDMGVFFLYVVLMISLIK